MIDTKPCDTCDQPILVFEGFEDLTTCSDCSIARERSEIPDEIKAAEWLDVMKWLDDHNVEISATRRLTVVQRLESWQRDEGIGL